MSRTRGCRTACLFDKNFVTCAFGAAAFGAAMGVGSPAASSSVHGARALTIEPALLGVMGDPIIDCNNNNVPDEFDLLPGPFGAVTSFANAPSPGVWYFSDMRGDGTATIADFTGVGGPLENDQPLPTGAACLTTEFDNGDKAQVGVQDNYGQPNDIFDSLNISYSYYKASNSGQNLFAAPSLKFSFFNSVCDDVASAGDCFGTLVYEPTWNGPGSTSATPISSAPPLDTWTTVNIDKDNGLFWWTGGFGQPNGAGGPPLLTLGEWAAAFSSDFGDSTLFQVDVGVGTFNQGQIGYFDDVRISHSFNGGYDAEYDFEVPAPPVSQDCNNNDIPDECDIANGTSTDCNNDGVPDECQQQALIGRPDPEGSTDRVMRGFIVLWAVNRENQQIRWNHLAGDATIVNYREGAAWEYTAYAVQSTEDGVGRGEPVGTPGTIRFNGDEYAAMYDQLLFNFQASHSIGLTRHGSLGADGLIVADTDLTLLPMDADFRQETDGPVSTKAVMNIWNQNEVKFSGTRRCVECWEESLLSDYDSPNAYLYGVLGTITGKARIDGLASTECDSINPATDTALLGVKVTLATAQNRDNGGLMMAGSNLHGMGVQDAVLKYDVLDGSPPESSDDSSSPYTIGSMLGVDQETIDRLVDGLANGRITSTGQIDRIVTDNVDRRRDSRRSMANNGGEQFRGRGQGQEEPSIGDPRLSNSEKGSVLVFPKVEIRWDARGRVIQDTFIQLVNDLNDDVRVQAIFVQGDGPLPFPCPESGWNWVDAEFTLTQNQPTYWNVRTGQPGTGGLPPFTVLD